LKNEAVLLEFALVQFALNRLLKKGFIPIVPPVMIREEMMQGLGYIDSEKDREERYFLEKDKFYLVGTSEQSVVPMHADEIFNEKDLPRRYAAFSTCFRREAGSYGKDIHGILRVHQFDKVEMVSFMKPEDSREEHKFLLAIQEELIRELKIPYRVVALSTGDLSHPSAATYDIEAWLPGQNEGMGQYRETHSCSNTTDFQARRLGIKFRRSGKTEFVHILNGTAFAIGRMLIAILENYQREDGLVRVPEALQSYMGGMKVIMSRSV
jgi:seryl-tRNA synthetase